MKLRVRSSDRFGTRRPLAERRLAGREYTGIDADDILEQARATIKAVARGRGGPHAVARAQAAGFVLSNAFLPHLTGEQLLFEVRRRADAAEARP